MKSNHVLAAALCVALGTTGMAYAETKAPTPKKEVVTNTTTRTVRPLAIDGKTKELKPAIQRFIERVNMARYALSQRDPKLALGNIDEAEKHLNFIRQNSRVEETQEKFVIASGRVTSDSKETFSSYYVPLEEGPVVVKSLETTDSQTGKNSMSGLAVSSVDLVYLNVDLADQTAPEYLAKARTAIQGADLKEADRLLSEMIDKVATTAVVDAMPLTKANDNLRLALKFLQDENYTASRHALDQSLSALKEAQGDARYNAEELGDVIQKTSLIRATVLQATSSAAQKARTQLIAVQNKVATMLN